ncbi:uncharacterized protein PHACADRAFT_257019 [Phanerochaete carnosa HHB-10118-sp]|uniref:Uncharacterized protein n=1 Tax=Phanerochaete carnosa (strain HHB-10118-sp) TaxID=650164 RepID=K5WAK6_PHACS|nr:uncharacterized protein PHACADRAFT_257019 [Phanerochaete carnosa HHB-10118-sp]EKM56009.1 hypothetical protein PHACADRAFT_257019 [Phanerochaete carnosa HHB-10118-sp]
MLDSLTHWKTQLNPFHVFDSQPSPRPTGRRILSQPGRPILKHTSSYTRSISASDRAVVTSYVSPRGSRPWSPFQRSAGRAGSPESRTPSPSPSRISRTVRIDESTLVRVRPQTLPPPRCPGISLPPVVKSDLTCADAVRTRFMLRKILPSRIVDRILKYAECFPTITQTSGKRVVVDDDILVLSIPLSQAQCDRIMHVSLLIRGHDQGWLPVLEGGPSKNSWTWYTMCTEEKLDPDRRLVKNRPGDPDTQTYRYEWSVTSDEVCKIKEGRKIEIWAHARYFGWKNVVEEAKITIRFQPLLTSDLAR